MNLRNRLMLMALLLVIVVMLVSTVVVYVIITGQNRDAARDLIVKSYNVMVDDLATRRNGLLTLTRQMAVIDQMPGKIKFITETGLGVDEDTARQTFKEIISAMRNAAKTNELWRITYRDMEGGLIAFAESRGQDTLTGYVFRSKEAVVVRSKLLKGEGEIKFDDWQAGNAPPPGFGMSGEGDKPKQEICDMGQIEGAIAMLAQVPIMGESYNRKTGNLETKQFGFVTISLMVDQAFCERMARLTGMEVDIFVGDAFRAGTLPDHKQIGQEGLDVQSQGWDLDKHQVVHNNASVQGQDYFQGVMPLYGKDKYIGAIACLYAKTVVNRNTWQIVKLLMLVSLGCVLMIVPVSIVFSYRLSKPIDMATNELAGMSDQLATAAREMSAASQTLAANSSKQAASLEEATAALEQMTAVTKQSTNGALQADELSHQSGENLVQANVSMKTLMKSMKDTAEAGNNVVKVVQTIDGIAFQINLLALNAAVEAARAGEAGAGFAVVADEVRNLAMRSAEASRNTHKLVEDIIQKIEVESRMVDETDKLYGKVAVGVQKVAGLVKEISSSSNEQLRDIEQVHKSVDEMNQGTQQNAANSGESAAASEEISAQASRMHEYVAVLRALVKGGRGRS